MDDLTMSMILDYGVSLCLITMFLALIHGILFKFPKYVKEDALPKLVGLFTGFQRTLEANTQVLQNTVDMHQKQTILVEETNNKILDANNHLTSLKEHLIAHDQGASYKYDDVYEQVHKIIEHLAVLKSEHQLHTRDTERIIQKEMTAILSKLAEINAVITMYANQVKNASR